jgi:hypothetical protein
VGQKNSGEIQMFNDSPSPKVVCFAERLLSQLMSEVAITAAFRNGDSPTVWDITNRICDHHHIEHLC